MNRRELIAKGAGAIAVVCVGGRVAAGSGFSLEPLCRKVQCENSLEDIAKQIMEETGEWKQAILRERSLKRIIVTLNGCCGCEITLPEGHNHPDWQYVRRNLTSAERLSFHKEYGQQSRLLLGMELSPGFTVRGFILDGRQMGWNYSVKRASLLNK